MSIEFDEGKFDVTKTNGVATVTYGDKEAFFEGTEISKKVLKEVFDYENDYIMATNVSSAKQATELMEKDKDINEVIVEFPFSPSARGKVNVIAQRSQTFRSPKDGSEVIKSTLRTVVKNPFQKLSKSKVQDLTKAMTETLLS